MKALLQKLPKHASPSLRKRFPSRASVGSRQLSNRRRFLPMGRAMGSPAPFSSEFVPPPFIGGGSLASRSSCAELDFQSLGAHDLLPFPSPSARWCGNARAVEISKINRPRGQSRPLLNGAAVNEVQKCGQPATRTWSIYIGYLADRRPMSRTTNLLATAIHPPPQLQPNRKYSYVADAWGVVY